MPDTNIGGYNLLDRYTNGKSAEECRLSCQSYSGCTAWVWLNPSWCSLKKEGGAEAPRESYKDYVSGLRDCKGRGLIVQCEPELNTKTGLDHQPQTSNHKLFLDFKTG